jgi:hypothetical protein
MKQLKIDVKARFDDYTLITHFEDCTQVEEVSRNELLLMLTNLDTAYRAMGYEPYFCFPFREYRLEDLSPELIKVLRTK